LASFAFAAAGSASVIAASELSASAPTRPLLTRSRFWGASTLIRLGLRDCERIARLVVAVLVVAFVVALAVVALVVASLIIGLGASCFLLDLGGGVLDLVRGLLLVVFALLTLIISAGAGCSG